ncbi:hypothetical protein D9M72_623290 [compost metagenome]
MGQEAFGCFVTDFHLNVLGLTCSLLAPDMGHLMLDGALQFNVVEPVINPDVLPVRACSNTVGHANLVNQNHCWNPQNMYIICP